MIRRERRTEYGKFMDKLYDKLHGKDIREFSDAELNFFVEGFTTRAWQFAANHPDPSKEDSDRHFVAQSFLDNQGAKQDLEIYYRDTNTIKPLQKKYRDFVLDASYDELYSAQLEQFLSYLEAITKEELNYLRISSEGFTEKEYDIFFSEVSNDAYYKLVFAMYICAQWYRTPKVRRQLSEMDADLSYDSQIFSAINSKASVLSKKTWFWIYDTYSSVWFPPNPFFVYSVQVKDVPEDILFRDGISVKGNEHKYYYSLDTSPGQMIPFARNLLLYIFDEKISKEPHCWERKLDSEITLKPFHSNNGNDKAFYNQILKYEKIVSKRVPSTSFSKAKIIYTVSLKEIRLSEVVFAEYNYGALTLNEWTMVFKNNLYPVERFDVKTYFNKEEVKSIIT